MKENQEKEGTEIVNEYFDRDLSWLTFNYRVLLEAENEEVPLYERLKFLAIYSSNQDEFFRVRVASIRRLVAIDKKKINNAFDIAPKKLLKKIHQRVQFQLDEYGKTLRQGVLKDLEKEGVFIKPPELLTAEQKATALFYFKTKVLSFLQPYQFEVTKREFFLDNRALYFSVMLRKKSNQKIRYAYVNIPSTQVSRFLEVPSENDEYHFILLDDLVEMHLDMVFPDDEVLECKSFKMNKDADLNIEDEYSGDLVAKIQKQIQKRNLGVPSRFLYDKTISDGLLANLKTSFGLTDEDLIPGGKHHSLYDFFQFPNPVGAHLEFPKQPALHNHYIDRHRSIFSAIDQSDQMLHFPYHSYDYILQFFNEAAIDPYVTEIKVTFYRMASDSLIGNALISAAKNGKRVIVFIELKARFDEENNLVWAEKMQKEGIKIIYSIPGLKVHAKVALVKKMSKGNIKRYGFYGTGNLNEKTASIYGDHGLLTCNDDMGKELDQLFKFLNRRVQPKPFEHLLVSQFNIIDRLHGLIDREMDHARAGNPARIVLKLNNLEERDIIDKLYDASRAGVKIELIIRSICCLVPGIKGMSENITVRRIVGRYLEHARVVWFANNGKDDIYMGSADWMKRNLKSRVEVTFPIYDPKLVEQMKTLLTIQLNDNTKAVTLDANQNNIPVKYTEPPVNAQNDAYKIIKAWSEPKKKG